MLISYNWLQTYFDTELPSPKEIEEKLTFHSFEIEGVENVGKDSVIDVDVLPNRAHDCLSHRGIAKELSVLFEIPLKHDVFRDETKELPQSKVLSVEIEDALLCRRYTGAVIKEVKVGPSPDWLKERIEAIGQQSINNVVDATNYVMFGLGQPLHAFDAAQLKEKDGRYTIKVRNAKAGEKITVLSGEEYELTPDNILIVDGNSNSPIGIAGVKGGMAAGIDEKTTDIIIESANFNPISTRKTSQYLKLRTDASTRFENELAPEIAFYGLIEAVALIQELAGGEVEGYVDEYPKQKTITYKVGVSTDEVNKLLGTDISDKNIENIFSQFGFPYEKVHPIEKILELAPTLKGTPYKYGASISYDAPYIFDCSSFIGYVFAQAGIALPRMVVDQYVYGKEIKKEDLIPGDLVFSRSDPATRKKLTFKSLANGEMLTHFGPQTESQEFLSGIKVEGGVSHNGIYLGEGNVIHASDSMGVAIEKIEESGYFNDIVGYRKMVTDEERYVVEIPFERLDLRIKEDLIEEVGRIYGYTNIGENVPKKEGDVPVHKKYYYAEKIRDFLTRNGFTEVYTYSLRDKGELEIENPLASDKNFVRSTLQNGIRGSLNLNNKNKNVLGLGTIQIFEIGNVFIGSKEHTSVCLGVSEQNKESEEVIERLFDELGIKPLGTWNEGIYEFNFDKVLDSLPEPKEYDIESQDIMFSYKPFSLFPGVLRDISVWTPKGTHPMSVNGVIKEAAGEILVASLLQDEYPKDERVSYSFSMAFQSQDKTLTDEEVNEIMKKITDNLNNHDGFEVR